jgi:hypothetical protein
VQAVIEQITAADRFSMPSLLWHVESALRQDPALGPDLRKIGGLFPRARLVWLLGGIVRHVFLIELVKVPKIETTKVRVRWFGQLHGDPRECPFDECLLIARDLLHELAGGWLDEESHRQELRLFYNHPVLSYELPIDYQAANRTRIHRRGNLGWAADPATARTLRLRACLTDPEAHGHAEFFQNAIDAKIKVKTYLTDRALTGPHKTNREKRW